MIVVTGAQGFIGSTMIGYLNKMGITDVVALDDFGICHQQGYVFKANYTNLQSCKFKNIHHISLEESDILPNKDIKAVFHFGAISNTLEKDFSKFEYYNIKYTEVLNRVCKQRKIPLIFSSTAAIYGNGNGPLNPYAESKLESEKAIRDHSVCLRLFNVYGQNEGHKGRMASVVFKWLKELRETGKIRIFENSDQYMRDFVYVNDICKIAYHLLSAYTPGVYDLGSGTSRSFEEVADCVISHYGSGTKEYISMPEDLRLQYQTDTKADLCGLQSIGIFSNMTSLEAGVKTFKITQESAL